MIQWLFAPPGAFIRIIKIYVLLIGGGISFCIMVTCASYLCRLTKINLYRLKRWADARKR